MTRLRYVLLVFLIITTCNNLYASSIEVVGSVSGEWNVDTVKVIGDIDIEMQDSLIIQPGVMVEFQGSYSFYIRGYVKAIGNMTDGQIIFDVADTTGFSVDTISKGGWNGIQFYYNDYTDEQSVFKYCIFKHGKAVSLDSLENHGGAVCVRNSRNILFELCTFESNFAALNGGAVYIDNSELTIHWCDFYNNRCGPVEDPWGYGGAICSDNASPHIYQNTFDFNSSTGVGGAVAIRFKDAIVNNNVFSYNYSALGGAIGFLHYYEYPYTQCNNLMFGNTAEFFGGGIACLDAGPVIVNNTLSGNASAYGGAFYVKDSIVPQVYNCIFWDNWASVGPEVYLWDAYASADFYYCDIKGGPSQFGGSGGTGYAGNYENNLDADPLFEDPANDWYFLDFTSPCIDAGTPDTSGLQLPPYDLEGYNRISFNGLIDMGCYEHILMQVLEDEAPGFELHIFPNPAKDQIIIQYPRCNIPYTIWIYNSSGSVIWNDNIEPETGTTRIELSSFNPGTYIIKLSSVECHNASTKFIISQ